MRTRKELGKSPVPVHWVARAVACAFFGLSVLVVVCLSPIGLGGQLDVVSVLSLGMVLLAGTTTSLMMLGLGKDVRVIEWWALKAQARPRPEPTPCGRRAPLLVTALYGIILCILECGICISIANDPRMALDWETAVFGMTAIVPPLLLGAIWRVKNRTAHAAVKRNLEGVP